MKVYEEHEEALGVQGMVQEQKSKRFIDKLLLGYATLFFIRFDEKNKFRLLPSYGVSTPTIVDKVINCEWLSGANNSWRREIFNDFEFDENLKRYSWGEDTDTSYRVYKKYPDSLFLTPHAKIIHKGSSDGRHLKKDIIYMDYVYYTYLFYKNIDQTTKNKLIYIWSRLGRLGLDVLSSAYQSDSKIEEIKHRICAPFYCLKHIKEIRAGDLEFFNKGLR
jgi:GT2 family glycosyltransferase